MVMESSEEDDDYLAHEWITPQSSVCAAYQSHTEKGIRKLCSELLELKDAVENLCGNMQSKYLAFLRLSEEAVEVEHELITLQKHVSAQGMLVQDLMSGVSSQLEAWQKLDPDLTGPDPLSLNELLTKTIQDPKPDYLDTVDALLAEHRIEEALQLLESKERENVPTAELQKRKEILEDQIVSIAEQPSLSITELKKSLSGLIKLNKGILAHQLLLKAHGLRLSKRVESFIPSCSVYPETYPATLSQLVFSTISIAAKDSESLFKDIHTNRLVQWGENEIENFVRLVKENSPLLETASALRSASVCVQASLSHCAILELEQKGLKFSKLVLVLLRPYMEEILDLNFRRARRRIVEMARDEAIMLTSSAKVFTSVIKENLDQLTPMAISHFGGIILNKILQLFDKYIEILIKALPSTEDETLILHPKETLNFRAETDSQQLALIGSAYTISDELSPVAVSQFFNLQSEEGTGGANLEYKEWRRHLGHSLDKLRDHFCRQYVLNFVYSREGEARLDARMYLEGKGEDDLFWESEPLPSYPFQALFGRLQQLVSVAGDVLYEKEKLQKIILSRLMETVVMWLSDEQEFWDVFENDSAQLQPFGLQQLILDMRFIVEIAVCGRYSSRAVHQLVSAIITRAIGAFSARGIDPQSALPEDEWFVDAAKAAISKLTQGTSGFDFDLSDEMDDGHIILHRDDDDDEMEEESESEESTDSIPESLDESSCDSFASANDGEIESPTYFTDPE